MHLKRNGAIPPLCSACGFRVFNRRYPKCERCGSALPASLLLPEEERKALLKGEEQRLNLELERARVARSRASVQAPAQHPTSSQLPAGLGSPFGLAATGDWSFASSSSGAFTSGGGGVFDGGGASGSFGGSSGGDGS